MRFDDNFNFLLFSLLHNNNTFFFKQAKEVFTSIFPNCEFLPRAPEPDEIALPEVPKIDEQENGVKEEDEMDLN